MVRPKPIQTPAPTPWIKRHNKNRLIVGTIKIQRHPIKAILNPKITTGRRPLLSDKGP